MRVTLLTCAGLSICAHPIKAQVHDGGVESPPIIGPTQFFAPGPLDAWIVSANGVYLVTAPGGAGGGGSGWLPASGAQSLDLNGPASPGNISQTVSDVSGATYDIAFELAGDPYVGPPIKTLDVLWDGSIVGTPSFNTAGLGPANMGWTLELFTVTGSGTDTLAFTSTTPGAGGPALDDVALVSAAIVAATPEPNGIVALLACLSLPAYRAASRFVRRRR